MKVPRKAKGSTDPKDGSAEVRCKAQAAFVKLNNPILYPKLRAMPRSTKSPRIKEEQLLNEFQIAQFRIREPRALPIDTTVVLSLILKKDEKKTDNSCKTSPTTHPNMLFSLDFTGSHRA